MAIFNHCLMEILAAAVPSYHVIWHDFGHWLKDHGLARPERQNIKELFADFPRKPDANCPDIRSWNSDKSPTQGSDWD